MIELAFRVLSLFGAVSGLPDVRHLPWHDRLAHAYAASVAETDEVPAEVLLSVAWHESRYRGDGVSRLECDGGRCRRVASRWPGRFPTRFRGPYFCGPTQLRRDTEAACRAVTLGQAYGGTVAHLSDWRRLCRRVGARDRWACALAGYGGGWRPAWDPSRSTYDDRVRSLAARLRSTVGSKSPTCPRRPYCYAET